MNNVMVIVAICVASFSLINLVNTKRNFQKLRCVTYCL